MILVFEDRSNLCWVNNASCLLAIVRTLTIVDECQTRRIAIIPRKEYIRDCLIIIRKPGAVWQFQIYRHCSLRRRSSRQDEVSHDSSGCTPSVTPPLFLSHQERCSLNSILKSRGSLLPESPSPSFPWDIVWILDEIFECNNVWFAKKIVLAVKRWKLDTLKTRFWVDLKSPPPQEVVFREASISALIFVRTQGAAVLCKTS